MKQLLKININWIFFQKLTKFEESIGVEFNHIRLLARAFTDRSIGYTNLTLGSNQRLEFLGDTVLQLIVSEYLYKYFPEHHEGHLSVSHFINFCNRIFYTGFTNRSHISPKNPLFYFSSLNVPYFENFS